MAPSKRFLALSYHRLPSIAYRSRSSLFYLYNKNLFYHPCFKKFLNKNIMRDPTSKVVVTFFFFFHKFTVKNPKDKLKTHPPKAFWTFSFLIFGLRTSAPSKQHYHHLIISTIMQPENSELYRFLAQNGAGFFGFPAAPCHDFSNHPSLYQQQSFCSSSSSYYSLEVSGTTDTTPQDRALAALKNHKEAEKRRRERINSHLDKLRTILPCNSKVIYSILWIWIQVLFLFWRFQTFN